MNAIDASLTGIKIYPTKMFRNLVKSLGVRKGTTPAFSRCTTLRRYRIPMTVNVRHGLKGFGWAFFLDLPPLWSDCLFFLRKNTMR
jgi:hypothetical protein